jgi:hypothetical protein
LTQSGFIGCCAAALDLSSRDKTVLQDELVIKNLALFFVSQVGEFNNLT